MYRNKIRFRNALYAIFKDVFPCKYGLVGVITIVQSSVYSMGENFQDYSWIQDFEADFPQKVSLKMLN